MCDIHLYSLSFLMSEFSAPSTPRTKGKGKSAVQLSSPVAISNAESDTPGRSDKPAKGDNSSSGNQKTMYG